MWTVRQAPSQRDTPMLSGRTLHDLSRVRWLDQNRDPARDRAWARGAAPNRDPRVRREGVTQNRDPARATRIAEISTLRLYCPLLNNNPPATQVAGDNTPVPTGDAGYKKADQV